MLDRDDPEQNVIELARVVQDQASSLGYKVHAIAAASPAPGEDYETARAPVRAAMIDTAKLNKTLSDVAYELIGIGVEVGLTQREMAECLGVPASALRGARKEFGR